MQSWTQHQGARHGLRTICSSQWQDQQRRSWREGRHKQHAFSVLHTRLIFGNTSNDEQDRSELAARGPCHDGCSGTPLPV